MDIFNRNRERNPDDHFSNLMFGRKPEPEQEESKVDYLQLMASVETLMGLYSQYKPTIDKINLDPLIAKFLKKNKKIKAALYRDSLPLINAEHLVCQAHKLLALRF
ncbi:hypothetical protein KEH51_27725 [[Brevibacterium] frigoritolerans]|uniref:Uncharacterized protein n=1 Tax=Peribacillus frigoritolerans TaxID=450367 RepID=A0A941JBZ8_9BACI|nr:hypothetical protein [Peribacillus frigoritolerans]